MELAHNWRPRMMWPILCPMTLMTGYQLITLGEWEPLSAVYSTIIYYRMSLQSRADQSFLLKELPLREVRRLRYCIIVVHSDSNRYKLQALNIHRNNCLPARGKLWLRTTKKGCSASRSSIGQTKMSIERP